MILAPGDVYKRQGQTRGDVCHGGPFLLGLLYIGIHKHRAAGAKVRGIFSKQGFPGKILHTVVQTPGKCLDEGAAAGGEMCIRDRHPVMYVLAIPLVMYFVFK